MAVDELEQFLLMINNLRLSNGVGFANSIDRRVNISRLRFAYGVRKEVEA